MEEKEFNELKTSIKEEFQDCQHTLDVFRRSLIHARTRETDPTELGSREGRTYAVVPLSLENSEIVSKSSITQENTIDKQAFQRRVCNKLLPKFLKRLLCNQRPDNMHGQLIYRVSHLIEGGIKFRKENSNCLWDIKFKNGVLDIPSIWIQDSTITILLNVAAFEHCHLKNISDAVIASYVVFMECLIKSSEDVAYLHRKGIIQHLLGSDVEVVDLFKSISKEMLVEAHGGYYVELSEQVNAYYNQRRHRWRATLLQKYLNSPWAIISLVVAFILLLLTAIQSFYAVYAYYKPNSK